MGKSGVYYGPASSDTAWTPFTGQGWGNRGSEGADIFLKVVTDRQVGEGVETKALASHL